MNVFVARQPIFDRDRKVVGYELLFRSGIQNYYDSLDPDMATADVISNSYFAIGFDTLTDGKPAFINFTRNLLTKGVADLLPTESVAVEILEDVEPDEEVIGICKSLKDAGFILAVDDWNSKDMSSPLLDYADIVKVDFATTEPGDREEVCRRLNERELTTLAEKVETAEEFDLARDWGFSLFQGYFFSKPVVHSAKQITGSKLSYLRMFSKVHQPGVTYEELEEIIKQDVSLTYKLLRFINSAWFGLRSEVRSIRHALVLLGPKEIKKWFALTALHHTATDKPHELMLRTVARARIAEGLAPVVGMEEYSSELFLMGMFSLIDALLDAPMAEIIEKLPLNEQLKKALLGQECDFKTVHDMIIAYEKGQWDDFSKAAAKLQINEEIVPTVYTESLKWADQAFTSI